MKYLLRIPANPVIALWLCITTLCCADEPRDQTLRVMTFNIRYETAHDGDDSWQHRKALVAQTIRGFDPDILGLQEALPMQVETLRQALPVYDYVGRSRDTTEAGEQCAILFRRQRLTLQQQATFWLSETPQAIGSMSWDSSLPRIVTWVELADQWSGSVIRVFNTHFDHRGQLARLESARLLRRKIDGLPPLPTVVLGDFNTADDSLPHHVLTRSTAAALALRNAYRTIFPERSADEATFHGFTGKRTGKPIDWILYSPHFTCDMARFETASTDQRYASDHFAVLATLSMRNNMQE